MGFSLTERDLGFLKHVHPDLRRVFIRAAEISPTRFRITEGVRTLERQKQLLADGATTTLNSRHLTGHAVDVVPYYDVDQDGDIDGNDLYAWVAYYPLAKIIKQAARELGVDIGWGGDWRKFKDGPHWQLTWKSYPLNKNEDKRKRADLGEPISERTSTGDTQVLTAGAAASTATAGEPIVQTVLSLVQEQETNITSGDWVRVAIGVGIIAATVYMVWGRK